MVARRISALVQFKASIVSCQTFVKCSAIFANLLQHQSRDILVNANRGHMKNKSNLILGVNSAYHEPSACLIRNGEIVAAAEEERFTCVRHGKPADLLNPHELPTKAIRFCLGAAGITAQDLGAIGFSFMPPKPIG